MRIEEKIRIDSLALIEGYAARAPRGVVVYFNELQTALAKNDYVKVQFCVEKICDFYEADFSYGYDNLIRLREDLREFNASQNADRNEKEALYKFWLSFYEWYTQQKDSLSPIFVDSVRCGHYDEDEYERKIWVEDSVCCNEDAFFKIEYGEELVQPDAHTISCEFVKKFIEMVYAKFLKSGKDGKYNFSIQINSTFSKFELPYRIANGKLIKQNYKTTIHQGRILNYEQFERKIFYSEQMILHNGLMDKHAALEYISDAFCYFYSLFKKDRGDNKTLPDDKTNIKIAAMVCPDKNSKQYTMVKDEVAVIKRIINNDYDIRHNEYFRSEDKSDREPLTNAITIEYLYNRIYALLYILRLKCDPEKP